MAETVGKYLLGIAALAAGTVIVIYGDPTKAKEWGSLATAVIGAVVLYQQRQQGQVLESQNRDHVRLTDKVDAVGVAVNGAAEKALEAKGAEAYAAGIRDATRELKPVIEAAVSAHEAP